MSLSVSQPRFCTSLMSAANFFHDDFFTSTNRGLPALAASAAGRFKTVIKISFWKLPTASGSAVSETKWRSASFMANKSISSGERLAKSCRQRTLKLNQ